jgi:ribosomal protein S18 acetylase RimI-like enzyme
MIDVHPCLESELKYAKNVSEEAFLSLREVYRPTPDAVQSKQNMASSLNRLVALDGPDVVGTVQYHLKVDRLHLLGLAVSPCRRRAGIARAIIEGLRAIAIAHKCNRLSLYTIEQTGNVKIFERLGFEVIQRTPAEGVISVLGESLVEAYMEMTFRP